MKETKKPNIIFILIDDMGWRDLGCYGSLFYETPNIDHLAKTGMRFTDAYAASPVCSPTRASIMSGKYSASVGLTDFIGGNSRGRLISAPYIRYLPSNEKSIAKALKEGGYTTWHIGKWHLGDRPYYPENHGFDVNVGGCHWGHPLKGYFSPYHIETMEDGPEGEYLTDRLTDEAIGLIQNHPGGSFFMNFWHYAVHTPIQSKQVDIDKYEIKKDILRLGSVQEFEDGDNFPCEHKKDIRIKRRLVQSDTHYAAMIDNLDYNIGRLINAVREAGQEDNTIIIFTSDNGGLSTSERSPTCNHPLNEGKGWMYEGGVREPLIIKWPGVIQEGSLCNVPVTSPDFYPTLLEAAGLDLIPEQHTDGISLLPLLKGSTAFDREAIYWHYPHYGNQGGTPGSSIRMGDYKLIKFYEDNHIELYNLKDDINEMYDLSLEKFDIAEDMLNRLREWCCKTGARIPKVNEDYH